MKNSEEEVQTAAKDGGIVSKRIPTAKTALSVYKKLRKADESSAYSRSLIQNLFNGNPPYTKAELRRRGLSWISNTDWGEFRSAINLNASSIWNMLVDVPEFVSLSTDWEDPQHPEKNYGMILARRFTQILREWRSFYFVIMFRIQEMLKFGVGTIFWADEDTWKCSNVRCSNFLVSAKAECDIDKIEIAMIRDEISMIELYRNVQDEEAARDMGWDVPGVKAVIKHFFENHPSLTGDRYSISDWESIGTAIQNLDDACDAEFDGVRIVHIYSKERYQKDEPNQITHQIIWQDDTEDTMKFLYEKPRRYKNMARVFHNFFFGIGEGYFKSVRGLGRDIFPHAHASNRLLNSMLTGVEMAGGMVLQLGSGASAESVHIAKKGPVYLLPADVDAQQRQVLPSLDPIVGARKVISNVQDNNSGLYRGRDEQIGDPRSATEIQKESFQEARTEGNQAVFFYVQHEEWLKEMFRRIMNPDYDPDAEGYEEHERLMELLDHDQFPEVLLDPDMWVLRAKRSIGLGSMSQKLQITAWMTSMMGALSEQARRNVLRHAFAVRVGWENVDEFVSELDDTTLFTMIHSMAEGENVDMLNGAQRTVAVDDPHGIHMYIVTQKIAEIAKAFEAQGQANEQMLMAMQLLLQHASQHLQYMAQDKTREAQVKQYQKAMQQFSGILQKMAAIVQQMAKQQAKQQEENQKKIAQAEEQLANRDHEVKLAKIESDAGLKKYEADLLHQSRMEKAYTSMQAQITQLQANLEALAMKTRADIDRENLKAEASMERKGTQ